MLVLTRKVGEAIIIGDDIEIKVIDATKGKVQIGIEAPREISIVRKEVLVEVKESNKEALGASGKLNLDDIVVAVKKSKESSGK